MTQEPTHMSLPISDIQLDWTNPRIRRQLDMYGDDNITAERIALALKEGSEEDKASGTTFARLRNSIIKNKGIITPIVINNTSDGHVCVEGNTRLLIYRELYESTKDKIWLNIPCLVYENANHEEMSSIRLQAHLIGPRPWDPYSKARYLAFLWDEEELSHDQIIEYCGGNKRQIADSIRAYRMVEEVYKPSLNHPEEFDHTRFSGFIEYQDNRVHGAVLSGGFNDKQFSMWLHDRKIQRLEHVRRLPEILGNVEAKEAFLKSGSNEAIKILNQPSLEELMNKHEIGDILDAVRLKITGFGYEDIQEYKLQADNLVKIIDDAVTVIGDFRSDLSD